MRDEGVNKQIDRQRKKQNIYTNQRTGEPKDNDKNQIDGHDFTVRLQIIIK